MAKREGEGPLGTSEVFDELQAESAARTGEFRREDQATTAEYTSQGILIEREKTRRDTSAVETFKVEFDKVRQCIQLYKKGEISRKVLESLGFKITAAQARGLGLSDSEIEAFGSQSVSPFLSPMVSYGENPLIVLDPVIEKSLLLIFYLSNDPEVTISINALRFLGVRFKRSDLVGRKVYSRAKVALLIKSGLVSN